MKRGGVKAFRWDEERWSFTVQQDGLIGESLYGTVVDLDEALGGIPFTVLKSILACTWSGYGEQAFIDLLNEPTASKRHIVTFFEAEFREHEKTSPDRPFFQRQLDWPFVKASVPCQFVPESDFPYLIELAELERWAARNADILPHEIKVCSSEGDAAQTGKDGARTSAATRARQEKKLLGSGLIK